jgi:hypothetical protein
LIKTKKVTNSIKKYYLLFILSVVLVFCNTTNSFSQNLINHLKKKEWISSTNEKIQFNDSSFSFLNVDLNYKLIKNRLIVYDLHKKSPLGKEIDSIEFGEIFFEQDSIILKISKSSSDVDKIYKGLFYNPSHYFKKVFDNKITFFDGQNINDFKKDVFKKMTISWDNATLSIDSSGRIEIKSKGYNPYFKVNTGFYQCILNSNKFIRLKKLLFESGSYSVQHNFYEKDLASRSDGHPSKYTISTKTDTYIFKSHDFNQNLSKEIDSIIINNETYNNCNLQLLTSINDSIKNLEHNIVDINEEYLPSGVESISGKIHLIRKINSNQYLYQLKVDSNYSQRNIANSFKINDVIYGICEFELTNETVGLIVQINISREFPRFSKDKVVRYFYVIKEFNPKKSIYFDYYHKYKPFGFSKGVNLNLPNYRKNSRFNKIEDEIYKLTKYEKQNSK